MTRISYEFFPPKSLEASFRLWDTIHTLAPTAPDFVSVTYGAGGTTRKLTHEAVTTINRATGLRVAAHLTCVDATRAETLEIARSYADAGITDIVALRGDMPGGGAFVPHPEGFASSVELIGALATHLVDRYGIEEMSHWWFEVWNEPNINFWCVVACGPWWPAGCRLSAACCTLWGAAGGRLA